MTSEDINNLANQFDSASVESSDDIREVVNVAQINPRLCLQCQGNSIIGKVITSVNMSRGSAEKICKTIVRKQSWKL